MANLPPIPDAALEGLPDLTARQFEFAKGIMEGKSLSDAFRAAYDCSKMQSASVWVEASRLRANPKVALWVSAWKRQGFAMGAVSLESHLAELERLKEWGLLTGNVGAAVKAEELRGKAAGVYLGDEQGRLSKASTAQLLELIRTMLGEGVAQAAADKLGVALLPKAATLSLPAKDLSGDEPADDGNGGKAESA
jgi:hypothetical protein